MPADATKVLDRWLSGPLVSDVLRHRAKRVADHSVTPSSRWPGHLKADMTAHSTGQRHAGSSITREMLGDAGRAVTTASTTEREDLLITAFVMCQMWGGGGSGRVMANTRKALADPSLTREALREFADAVASDPAAAALGNLPGWRRAFSTKLGYALTYDRAVVGGRPALIYDSYVIASLGTLGVEDHGGYCGYLEAVWEVAARHQVRPDALEQLLFSPKLDLRTWGDPRLD